VGQGLGLANAGAGTAFARHHPPAANRRRHQVPGAGDANPGARNYFVPWVSSVDCGSWRGDAEGLASDFELASPGAGRVLVMARGLGRGMEGAGGGAVRAVEVEAGGSTGFSMAWA